MTKFTDSCTEAELLARCAQLRFSEENTCLAVAFFIKKTRQKVIADDLGILPESVAIRKYRMKRILNGC